VHILHQRIDFATSCKGLMDVDSGAKLISLGLAVGSLASRTHKQACLHFARGLHINTPDMDEWALQVRQSRSWKERTCVAI
jgi:hypothetical protein